VLKTLWIRLVSLIILLVLLLHVLVEWWRVQGLTEARTLEKCMLGLWVHRVLFVQELVELLLLVPRLLAVRVVLDSHDSIVWLALSGRSQVVPLAFVVGAMIIVALAPSIVVVLG
jgi:hypothetical protein